MRHIRRNDENHASLHREFLALGIAIAAPRDDPSDLLIVMMMQPEDSALFCDPLDKSGLHAMQHLPLHEGRDLLDRLRVELVECWQRCGVAAEVRQNSAARRIGNGRGVKERRGWLVLGHPCILTMGRERQRGKIAFEISSFGLESNLMALRLPSASPGSGHARHCPKMIQ
jgi:hypothetical protein